VSAVERVANRLQARLSWPQAEACAADIADLLVTDEIQAVLDAAVQWATSGEWGGWTGDAVEAAVDAYLASRGEP
jgi:hypothetical protein